MNDPDLLILDEPASGLNPVLQDTFRELLAERKARGATVWLTSHVMSDVEHVADRVGLIDRGRLTQELTMSGLRRQTTGDIGLTFTTPPDELCSWTRWRLLHSAHTRSEQHLVAGHAIRSNR